MSIFINALKNKIFLSVLLIILIVFCTIFPPQMLFWYKFYYMPVIGVLGFLFLKGKWYLAPLFVFTVSSITLLILNLINNLPFLNDVYNILQLGFYNFIASLSGCVIALLLRYVFKKNTSYEIRKKPVHKFMPLRIFLGLTTIIFICGIMLVVNSIFGNPISSVYTYFTIKNYTDKNYKELDLDLSFPLYNFYSNNYGLAATSKSNKDIKFSIDYRNGKVIDNYKNKVNKVNDS